MFTITSNKGFQVTFPNGYTVSVQWGPQNYCANRRLPPQRLHPDGLWDAVPTSADAEVAVIGPDSKFCRMLGDGDDVRGWVTPAQVAALMAWAAALPMGGEKASVPAELFQ